MNAIVICECSDTVTDALKAVGVNAHSCDLKPSEHNRPDHIQADCRTLDYSGIDLVIAHPDCTYLASSGLHWNKRIPGRQIQTRQALSFVRGIMEMQVEHICIENPVGCISTEIDYKSYGFDKQTIQPYQFGEDASKATVLFLKNLPKLTPTKYVEPRTIWEKTDVDGIFKAKKRWTNQTDSGQNRLAPSDHRKADRARTYQGIARAMAEQWGNLPPERK